MQAPLLKGYRQDRRAVYLYGFAKKDRDNIEDDDLARLKKLAAVVLSRTDQQIAAAMAAGEWREVKCDEQEEVSEQAGRRGS